MSVNTKAGQISAGTVLVIGLLGIVIAMGLATLFGNKVDPMWAMTPPESASVPPAPVPETVASRLTPQDNGWGWQKDSVDGRMRLCGEIAKRMRAGMGVDQGAGWYYDLLDATYRGPETAARELTIAQTVGLAIAATTP